jgi:CRISPR/Cas system endoribonuclease Cas6 (RAMP superfamily)
MQLGGIMGHINYDEIDAKSYALLKLGEIMGVGKQTVFGLGEIRVDKLTETDNISA